MTFSVEELENAANAAIEYHFKRGTVYSQTIQDKPLYKALRAKQKDFPGGKDNITVRVKGTYTSAIQGFSHDGTVTYSNPANIKKATFPWKLIHEGIKFTKHELLIDGVSVGDKNGTTGKGESSHSDREMTALANILDDKMEDMKEGWDRSFNLMLWRDGTQDADLVPGILSFILNDPTSATVVGGIDQSSNTWWRNRATLAIASNSSTWSAQPLVQELQNEFRQLRRYGGRPNLFLAGSDFLDAFENELRSKGNYTLEGWAKSGKIDASVADVAFKGLEVQYDPTLDDLSKAKYGYVLDTNHIFPMVVDGEDMQPQYPARPENQYVYHRAMTWVGGLVCRQRNCHGVYSIA